MFKEVKVFKRGPSASPTGQSFFPKEKVVYYFEGETFHTSGIWHMMLSMEVPYKYIPYILRVIKSRVYKDNQLNLDNSIQI